MTDTEGLHAGVDPDHRPGRGVAGIEAAVVVEVDQRAGGIEGERSDVVIRDRVGGPIGVDDVHIAVEH
jgi:hypothetical protein